VVILIVDNNAAVRRLIRRTIAGSNYEIHECADGDEALKRFSEISPDLTLMDIRMPGTDGLTATRKIIEKYPDAQIVIVTDFDVREIKAAAFTAGAKAYVLKDNLSDIEAVISGLLMR
jgi:CheY-like chemotaxis protein